MYTRLLKSTICICNFLSKEQIKPALIQCFKKIKTANLQGGGIFSIGTVRYGWPGWEEDTGQLEYLKRYVLYLFNVLLFCTLYHY